MRYIILIILSVFIFIGCADMENKMDIEACLTTEDPEVCSAENLTIPADGESYAEITVDIRIEGEKVADGADVDFVTTAGSFSAEDDDELDISVDTVSSKATVKLYAPLEKGNATVTATYTDKNSKKTLTATVDIEFGDLSEGNKLSAKYFALNCENKNIGAFIDESIVVECFVIAKNRKGEIISVPEVNFSAEAGRVEKIDGRYFYFVEANQKPKDVDPDDTKFEPSRVGNDGKTKNPRDGLVTIIAYANGEEGFNDLNSDGEWNTNEQIDDMEEPYIDANDNGVYDDDEVYVDLNDNDQWDYANGAWDTDTTIYTTTKILYTGRAFEADDATRFESSNDNIVNLGTGIGRPLACGSGNSFHYDFYLLDENLNPIAANEDDTAKLEISASGFKVEDVDKEIFLIDTYAMEFDEKWRVQYFEGDATKYRFYIRSIASTDDCEGASGEKNYTVTADLSTYPAKRNDQYKDRNKYEKTWTFQGTISGTGGGE